MPALIPSEKIWSDPLLINLVHDEVLNVDDGLNPKAQAAHLAQACPAYAFAVARAIRDQLHAMTAQADFAVQPPPVSVEITFVTAPINSHGLDRRNPLPKVLP
ncbi:hypothetical protein N657DRAFT_636890 [Parathielavia appendiculata]|uniref:Uncharacterized protein n=1 Tax=Parathielavia appendiculata TaxID=2587402 RepID=A0AAN6Z056_9PEZI|nr:hypothetical protein N657DRAFT_636890 [Parathielavia appendiculata]